MHKERLETGQLVTQTTHLVIQKHGARRGVGAKIARDDSRNANLLSSGKKRTLSVEYEGVYGGDEDIRAVQQRDQLFVRRFGEIRTNKQLGALLLEFESSSLSRRAHDSSDSLTDHEMRKKRTERMFASSAASRDWKWKWKT